MSFPAYTKYKDSGVEWLGQVPESWSLQKLRRLFDIKKRIAGQLGYDVFSITQNGIRVKDIESNEGQLSMDYTKYQLVHVGDFAMNPMDLITGGADIATHVGVTSPDYRVFSLRDQHDYHDRFLLFLFQHIYRNKIFYAYGQGSSQLGRWRLPRQQFNNFTFPIPPLPEQQAIASFLDRETSKIDALVAEQRKLIELLKEKRQAVISHAVTKGLIPDAPMKDSGIEWLGMVPEHWEVVPIHRIVEPKRPITYGIVQPGEQDESGRFMIRNQDFTNGWASPDSIFRVSEEIEKPYSRARMEPNDLIMTIVGAVGSVGVIPNWLGGANTTQNLARIAIDQTKASPFYVASVLQGPIGKRNVDFYSKGAVQTALNLGHVRQFWVTVPPLTEQTQIVDFINARAVGLDSLQAEAQHAIELLQERRTALISAAVTGKIDIRNLLLEPPNV